MNKFLGKSSKSAKNSKNNENDKSKFIGPSLPPEPKPEELAIQKVNRERLPIVRVCVCKGIKSSLMRIPPPQWDCLVTSNFTLYFIY